MITTRRWPLGGHICIALAKVGFDVAVISPPKSPLRAIDVIRSHFKYGRFAPLSSIERAIATASPDLLICADDWAVAHLHRIYDRASKSPRSKSLANLIETSLGDPAGFRTAETMTGLIGLAQSEQLPCPKTTIVSSNGMLEKALQHATYPVLLKGDGYSGGGGVRILRSRFDATKFAGEMQLPILWSNTLRRAAGKYVYAGILKRLSRWPSIGCVQEFISGVPANRAVLCWKGTVVAGISVEACETIKLFGATSLARIIDNDQMSRTADLLVARLGMSGFVGFDFVLDSAGNALLLEMNARVTPIAHIPTERGDLISALYTQMTGRPPALSRPKIAQNKIALFPQEVLRSKGADHLSSSYHDVPWDQSDFVAAALSPLPRSFLGSVRSVLRRRPKTSESDLRFY